LDGEPWRLEYWRELALKTEHLKAGDTIEFAFSSHWPHKRLLTDQRAWKLRRKVGLPRYLRDVATAADAECRRRGKVSGASMRKWRTPNSRGRFTAGDFGGG
jgi:hypothetical protein